MRREKGVTVQGPVKEQQPDGMSHRGSNLLCVLRPLCVDLDLGPEQFFCCIWSLYGGVLGPNSGYPRSAPLWALAGEGFRVG